MLKIKHYRFPGGCSQTTTSTLKLCVAKFDRGEFYMKLFGSFQYFYVKMMVDGAPKICYLLQCDVVQICERSLSILFFGHANIT